jgi:hypothetical protein
MLRYRRYKSKNLVEDWLQTIEAQRTREASTLLRPKRIKLLPWRKLCVWVGGHCSCWFGIVNKYRPLIRVCKVTWILTMKETLIQWHSLIYRRNIREFWTGDLMARPSECLSARLHKDFDWSNSKLIGALDPSEDIPHLLYPWWSISWMKERLKSVILWQLDSQGDNEASVAASMFQMMKCVRVWFRKIKVGVRSTWIPLGYCIKSQSLIWNNE